MHATQTMNQTSMGAPTSALTERFVHMLGCIRAMQIWFHAAHNLTKGTGFVGDHVDLYAGIYGAMADEYDSFAERAIGLTNDEMVACPVCVTKEACEYLAKFPSPANASALLIASTALSVVKHHLDHLTSFYNETKASDEMTLGLDDLVMATCSAHETNVYLLQQRVKAQLDG